MTELATNAAALRALHFELAYSGGFMPVFMDGAPKPKAWVERPEELVAAALVAERQQVEACAGLPEAHRDNGGPAQSTVLWVWVEGGDQVARAHRFRPAPSVVLRMGQSSRRLLLWLLDEPHFFTLIEAANKRLAYALHAPQKWAQLEKLRVPLPGTFLRLGRVRPAPVTVTRMVLDEFAREAVVGRLKDPPPPYMQRLREARGER